MAMRPIFGFALLTSLLSGVAVPALADRPVFHISNVTAVADSGLGGDHISLDAAHRHVVVGRGKSGLSVLDAETRLYLQSVAETNGTHGAARSIALGQMPADPSPKPLPNHDPPKCC